MPCTDCGDDYGETDEATELCPDCYLCTFNEELNHDLHDMGR